MKNKFKKILLAFAGSFILSAAISQNVSLNMLVLNSGLVPLGGNGTVQATVNATIGTAGQTNAVAAGKINVQITVPPSLLISATQNNLPAGWIVRNNNGTVINLCNSAATIDVNTAVNLLVDLQGVTATTGSPSLSGQISFRTNCNAPGSLTGDNVSDNSSQAGFSVAGTVPVRLTNFNAALINCKPVLNWVTENEVNSSRFEIERSDQNAAPWIFVGAIQAQGNTAVRSTYNFVDETIPATSKKILYRLKSIDEDGRYTYSTVLPVFINCRTAQVNVYPNPVQNGNLNISLSGGSEAAEATLLSYTGQVILKLTLKMGNTGINVSNIPNGEYLLNVNFRNGLRDKIKVLIQQ